MFPLFFFQAEDGIRDKLVTGVQTCALPISFCRSSRRRVKELFRELWSNDDDRRYRTALDVLNGRYAWLQTGILGLDEQAPGKDAGPKSPERERLPVSA